MLVPTGAAGQQNHPFNLPFNTPVNRAAATQPAQRAHYARLYAAAGFGWVGKQMKRRSRSPESPVPVKVDNVEEIAS